MKIIFFAIFPTEKGPVIYYQGNQFQINRSLSISLVKRGENRKFIILDYGIKVDYKESPYIGFDVWSDEIDVDLFYMIEQSYKSDSFYERYTLKSKQTDYNYILFWGGTKDLQFNTLEEIGYDDHFKQKIQEFNSDKWYKK